MRGIRSGAPQAQQVADRWHWLKNLREALERMLNRLRTELENLPHPATSLQALVPSRSVALDAHKPNRQAHKQASRARRLARYDAVRALVAQGVPELRIARELGLARAPVHNFDRAVRFPERAVSRVKASMIDAYLPYLERRMAEGCTVSMQLWREIQAQEYTGSRHQVVRWMQQQRTVAAPTTPRPYLSTSTSPPTASPSLPLPAPRQLVLRADEERTDEEKANFARIRQHPTVQTAYQIARQFQRMIHERSDAQFSSWLHNCQGCDIPNLQTFAAGLEREEPSIRLALSTAWSNGPTEGHVNRLKLIKRSMYGRAKFDLLRIRVLASTA